MSHCCKGPTSVGYGGQEAQELQPGAGLDQDQVQPPVCQVPKGGQPLCRALCLYEHLMLMS